VEYIAWPLPCLYRKTNLFSRLDFDTSGTRLRMIHYSIWKNENWECGATYG
jgi:hypothetical protein